MFMVLFRRRSHSIACQTCRAILNVFQIQMQLRVYDEKKRKQYRFKENEGLQFAFDIENDTAEEVSDFFLRGIAISCFKSRNYILFQVVQQMIEQQHIPDEDTKMITKLIKDKVWGAPFLR